MATIGPKSILGGAGAWAVVDGVCITLLPMKQLSLDDWKKYLDETKVLIEDNGLVMKATISFYGFDVSAQHRKLAAEAVTETARNIRHILLTDSVVMRGAIRAFAWIMPSVRINAYAPNDWRSGSQWLQATAPHNEHDLGAAITNCFAKVGMHGAMPKSA